MHEQHDKGQHEIDHAGEHGGDRHGQPREIDLRDQVGAAHQAVGGLGQPVGKECPGHQRRVGEDRIGDAVRRHARQAAKEEAEDHHGQEGLDDGPGRAQHRLLVAHLDVAPGQEVEQLAIVPQLAQLERDPALSKAR